MTRIILLIAFIFGVIGTCIGEIEQDTEKDKKD